MDPDHLHEDPDHLHEDPDHLHEDRDHVFKENKISFVGSDKNLCNLGVAYILYCRQGGYVDPNKLNSYHTLSPR